MFGDAKAALSLYCQGLNQSASGTCKNCRAHQPASRHRPDRQARRRAVLASPASPTPWAGAKSAAWRTCCPAHRDLVERSTTASEVAALWGVPTRSRASPARRPWRCSKRSAAARSRRCGSPAPIPRSRCPTSNAVRKALERAELVVVQEAFRDAETCAYADVLLPAASWGEKEGTVTNSERRISRVRAAVPPPGEARAGLGDRGGLRARRLVPRDGGDAVSLPDRRKRSSTSTARPRAAATSTSPASPTRCSSATAAAMALPGRRNARPHAPLRRRRLSDALGPRALRRHRIRAAGRGDRRAVSAAAHHRAPARPVAQHDAHRPGGAPLQPQPGAGNRAASSTTCSDLGIEDGDLVRVISRRGSAGA